MEEPRKATDVLLEIESKINSLEGLLKNQEMLIKILANKITDLSNSLKNQPVTPKFSAETSNTSPIPVTKVPVLPADFTKYPVGDPEKNIPIAADISAFQPNVPVGFRRSSRPETYVNKSEVEVQFPIQIPPGAQQIPQEKQILPPPGRGPGTDIIVASNNKNKIAPPANPNLPPQPISNVGVGGQIPVTQRCVDKNGKSIFLAEVEIVDLSNDQSLSKTRTNGTGKWMAALPVGNYRVTVSKREAITKERIEAVQDIKVDGTQSKLELPTLIIK